MTTTNDDLGPLAERLIDTSGISMVRLSRVSGVAQATLSRWRRRVYPPAPVNALKLASAARERALKTLDAATALEAAARAQLKVEEPDA